MEKVITPEDRIRRAEEIYFRRKNNLNMVKKTTDINTNKSYKKIKKATIQILSCVGIFFLINSIQANNDDLSKDLAKYIKNTLIYDMNLQQYIDDGKTYLNSFFNKKDEQYKDNENVNAEDGENINNISEISDDNEKEQVTDEEKNDNNTESAGDLSQEEQDAKYIKEKFSLIKPVEGEISSRFGPRNPTTDTVPKYHTGIDIAVPEGTKFISAMEGIVELVSSEGDYRKPYKNF